MFFALGLAEPERCKLVLVKVGKKLEEFMQEVDRIYSFREVSRRVKSQELSLLMKEVLEENSKIQIELECMKKEFENVTLPASVISKETDSQSKEFSISLE